MTYNYHSVQKYMLGGKKTTKKVIIKNGKGYKSICKYKNGKICHSQKKRLLKHEIQFIQIGKFIPGLFNDINTRKNKNKKNMTRKNYY